MTNVVKYAISSVMRAIIIGKLQSGVKQRDIAIPFLQRVISRTYKDLEDQEPQPRKKIGKARTKPRDRDV